MAKIALAVVGAVAGAAVGLLIPPFGVAMMWESVALGAAAGGSMGMAVGGMFFRPQVPGMLPLQDRQVSSSADGSPIPYGYGTGRIAGQVIWSPGITYHTVGDTSGSSKGGGAPTGLSYFYLASFAASFGEGPATIQKIWADSKLIYNGGAAFGTYTPWNSGANYNPDDLVSYQFLPTGRTDAVTGIFQCVIGNSGIEPAGNSLYWLLTSYTYWRHDIAYQAGNQVAYPPENGSIYAPTSGQIYTCVNPCTNVTPAPAGDWNTMGEYYPAPTLYTGARGDTMQLPDPTIQANNGVDATPAFRGLAYAVWENMPLATFGNRVPNLRAQINYGTGTPDLGEVVSDLCLRAGLASGQIDTSLLSNSALVFPSNTVNGYIVERMITAAAAIKELMIAYFFGACESDGVLKFVPRTFITGDQASPATPFTILEDDLGLEADKAKLEETQTQEQDLPLSVTVLYNDVALNWQQGKQVRQRNQRTVTARNQQLLSIPLSLSNTNAIQIAEATLYSSWQVRQQFSANLWRAVYMMLDPTDIVFMQYEGLTFEVRLLQNTLGQGFAVTLKMVSEDVRNYFSNAQGVASEGFAPAVPIPAAITFLFLLDISLLRDQDANAAGSGFYAVFGSNVTPSPGAVLYASSDGTDYTPGGAVTVGACFGYAAGALGAPLTPWAWDTINSLTIGLVTGALAGVTDAQILAGQNALIVGSEILQFANAVQNSDGTWTVSRLLRGRRGTDAYCYGHEAGELVVAPGEGGVLRVAAPLAQIGQLYYYRGVTAGQDMSAAPTVDLTLAGHDLKPYSPVAIAGQLDSGNNWIMAWIRRTRFGGAYGTGGETLIDGVGGPLNEEAEAYQVDILGGSPLAVVRTLSVSSPFCEYTEADQIADFGAVQTSLEVDVYQMNAAVGRGWPGMALLPASSDAPVIAPGGGGGGGGGTAYYFGQTSATGIYNVITLPSSPLTGTIQVFVDGLLTSAYTVAGEVISLTGLTGSHAFTVMWTTLNSTPGDAVFSNTSPYVSVRGSSYYLFNATTPNIPLPPGTVAGDLVIVAAGQGYPTATGFTTGWTQLNNSSGSDFGGICICKVVNSSDITTGYVNITWSGGYYGVAVAVAFVGATAGVRECVASQTAGGAAQTTVSSSNPLNTDTAVYFGLIRDASNVTVNRGTQLQQINASQQSGALYVENLAASGTVTAVTDYSSFGDNSYQGLVIVKSS